MKEKKRIGFSLIIYAILAALFLIICAAMILLYFKSSRAENKMQSLSATAKEAVSERDALFKTVSQQAATIENLNSQLVFFATPEEAVSDSALTLSSDAAKADDPNEAGAYPNLFAASKSTAENENKKIAYLTFDDGPSNLTPQVLDLLDQYHAKATFFVIATDKEECQPYYKEILKRGHTLALHSYSHNYNQIYASVDAFLKDYQKLYDLIYEKTNYICSLYRYPGGSKNSYNRNVINQLISEMDSRGFIYYDWNVSCGDGNIKATRDTIYHKVIDEVKEFKVPVILMHDGIGHEETIAALPSILQELSQQGYTFEALTPQTKPVQFPHK